MATLANHAQATCIVVYRDSRELIVAADSRRFQQNTNPPYTKEAQTITKVNRIGRTIFASAGSYNFSAYDLAVESFDGRKALSEKVDVFKSAATKSLQRMIDSLQIKVITGEIVFNAGAAVMQVLIVDYDRVGSYRFGFGSRPARPTGLSMSRRLQRRHVLLSPWVNRGHKSCGTSLR
jgi:hypothetical protein